MKVDIKQLYLTASDNHTEIIKIIEHSKLVYKKALNIIAKNPELNYDKELIKYGSLLHDIGVLLLKKEDNYLIHGYLGGQFLRKYKLPYIARIAERHIGVGLTKDDLIKLNLPIPKKDYLPKTLNEEIITLADKFYSKSIGSRELTIFEIIKKFEKIDPEKVTIFLNLCRKYHLIEN